jgi:ubiquinone/menaquinone biosynthesis C-methylase UbiE
MASAPETAAAAAPAPQAPQVIAVDPEHDHDDNDSLDGDTASISSSTASLSESVLEFRKIHGRTFHNFRTDTEYWGPNDEKHNDYLDLNHEMLLLTMDNKLYYAPIGQNPQRVLDVGTGTGIWAIDFAEQHPSAEVIGTDLSPTQPSWVPPNLKFELDDAQLDWTFPDNHFDFIHVRLLMGSIRDWPKLYSEIYRCLKPGGYLEHQEFDPRVISDDDSIPEDSAWKQWGDLFIKAGQKLGQAFDVIVDSKNVGLIKDAGFQDVTENKIKMPLGNWPRDPKWKSVGNYNIVATEEGLEGFALYILTQVHGWELAQTQVYLASVRKELKSRTNHAYFYTSCVYGRKPE